VSMVDAGAAIRRLRESRNMSLARMSAVSGVSTMGLSYLERGVRKPRRDTIRKLEVALGLPSGTYNRLATAQNPHAELQALMETASSAAREVVVVGRRRDTTALFDGYAEAQISALQAVISRLPSQTASDYESYIAYVYEQCLKAERLTANSWRVAAQSESSDAARLAGHLETLELTRQSLVTRLEGRSLSAQLDMACVRSPLSDYTIAEMLDTTAEQLWRWRNQEAIPGEAVELVQAFVATSRDRNRDDQSG
jgi:transcriptional regulator with XRE-family HTH domain